MVSRCLTTLAATAVITAAAATAIASTSQRVFYLTVKPHTCLVAPIHAGAKGYKTVAVVGCSDPAHNMEAYGIGHGGWGHGTPPSAAAAAPILRTTCLAMYQRLTGHPLRVYGWYAFYPDPGAETARYGDKIICSLRTYPIIRQLGAGWHVH